MPVERTIAGVSTSVTAFVGYTQRGSTNEPTQLFGYGDFERAFGGLDLESPVSYAVQQFFQNGGLEAWVVRVAAPADIEGDEATKTGIYSLEAVDLFNILCLPPLPGAPEPGTAGLLAAATTYCEKRRAFLLVDLPGDVDTVAEARNWVVDPGRTKSSNAAVYFPWVVLDDPLRGQRRAFPPSGMLAGLYARTGLEHGVWKAPAGIDAALRGAQGVAYDLSDADNGVLNPLGLNAIRSVPDLWDGRLGRAHAHRLGRSGERLEVHRGAEARALPRGEPVPGNGVGRVRAERRAPLGAAQARCRRVHAKPLQAGRFPGVLAA